MLGTAEADLEAHLIDWQRKQRAQIGGCGFRQIEPERRQQRVEQRCLPWLERVAFAPPEEGAL
jgi:hypothetical protein